MFGFTFPWPASQGGDASAPEASEVNGKELSVQGNAVCEDLGGDGGEADDGANNEGNSEALGPSDSEKEDDEPRTQSQDSSNPEASGTEPLPEPKEAAEDSKKPIKLYKSPRLKGYITIVLASGIHFNSVQRSGSISSQSTRVVPSTPGQRQYGLAVCTVNMVLCIPVVICHLDRITPLEKVWTAAFRPKSTIELLLAVFLSIWNFIAVGVETSINGIAGSGKGQFNIYFSVWILCLTSLWILERWWIDYGWSSFRSFVTSWPYRAPAWICIIILSVFDMIWTVDMWRNYNDSLTASSSNSTDVALSVYESVPQSQWQWFVILLVFTLLPAVAFVAIELFRDTNADGSTQEKSKVENVVEGVIFLLLVLAWIPTVGTVTTPNGAASMIGNAYFFTWLLVVFIFEGLIWWVHDYRFEIHEALRAKESEYRKHQREVLAKTRKLQKELESRGRRRNSDVVTTYEDDKTLAGRTAAIDRTAQTEQEYIGGDSEYFDASEAERY